MVTSLFRRFIKDRMGATAVALAIMTVPLFITASAAVDFSRISSARTLLQASADSAAIAGAGSYQFSESVSSAHTVAQTTYNGSGAQLTDLLSATSSSIGVYCASTTECGASAVAAPNTSGCPAGYEICVVVSGQGTLKNSLFAFLIPSDFLSAKAIATTEYAIDFVPEGSFTDSYTGGGSDLDKTYGNSVPEDADGNILYGTTATVNSSCDNSSFGPIADVPNQVTVPSSTPCNFLLIGGQTSGSGSGELSFFKSDPVEFTFVSFTGGNITTGSTDLDATSGGPPGTAPVTLAGATGNTTLSVCETNNTECTHYGNEIFANGTYYSAGETVCSQALTGSTCKGTQQPLYGFCPAHNFYGSINAYPNATTDNVPLQDSINVFTSGFEMLGLPPTYATNHLLIPFLGPQVFFNKYGTIETSAQTGGYAVQAVCPDWPRNGTNLNTTGSYGFTPTGYSATTETVNTYSTYYPGQTYSDGVATDYYPPAISACTPITSPTAALPNASTTNPWWGWSPSNASDDDPSKANWGTINNCTFGYISSTGSHQLTPDTSTTAQANPPFTSAYDNCAFAIQSLGNSVTTLPNYYTYTMSATAFSAGTTGNAAGITAITPHYSGSPSGSISITANGGGSYTVNEPTAESASNSPPEDTSHQCYNPLANGFTASFAPTDNGTPVDPFANPQYGAVLCNSATVLPSYAVYWNDMGSYASPPLYNDDLGYQNQISVFTCPAPTTASGGGAATLSG
jgi:Flp pilus assembly protein TadG